MKHEQKYANWNDADGVWPYRQAGFIVNPTTHALEWAVVETLPRKRTPEEQAAYEAWDRATNLWGPKV